MITFAAIRDSLSALIKVRAGLPLEVHFNRVDDAENDYAFIQLRPRRTDWGFGWMLREIRVDITICLHPGGFAERRASNLYEIFDALDNATMGAIPIADRFITVYDCDARIFDDLGTYSFILSFDDIADAMTPAERAEFMEHLHLSLNEHADSLKTSIDDYKTLDK